MKYYKKAILTAFLVATSACGGDSSSTQNFSSGLAKNQTIASLSAEDRQVFCRKLNEYNASLTQEPYICTAQGVADAFTTYDDSLSNSSNPISATELVTVCKNSERSCITNKTLGDPNDCSLIDIVFSILNLGASVGELESCISELANDNVEASQGLSCEEAGAPNYLDTYNSKILGLHRATSEKDSCAAFNVK